MTAVGMVERTPFGGMAIGARNNIRARAPHSLLAQMMTTAEAAKYLGIGLSTLTQYRHKGTGPKAYKHRRAYYYKPAELDAWKASR